MRAHIALPCFSAKRRNGEIRHLRSHVGRLHAATYESRTLRASFMAAARLRESPPNRDDDAARLMHCTAVMLLKQIMKPGPLTAEDTDRLGDTYRKMTGARSRHLPVLHEGKLTGILSERDILEYRAKCGIDEDWWRAPVAAAMRSPVQTAGPDDSLTEAAGRMAASKIGALPVVELGKLVGLITVTDVLAAEVDQAMH